MTVVFLHFWLRLPKNLLLSDINNVLSSELNSFTKNMNPDILVWICNLRAEADFACNRYYNKTMKSYLGYTGWDLLIFPSLQNLTVLALWLKILNPLSMCAKELLYKYPVPAKNLQERLMLKINCNQYTSGHCANI